MYFKRHTNAAAAFSFGNELVVSLAVAALALGLNCTPEVTVKQGAGLERVQRASFQSQIRNDALPLVLSQLKGMDENYAAAAEFGNWLDTVSDNDIDRISVASDAYWNAFVIVPMDNPSVFLSRICLLIQDGDLVKAQYLKVFTNFHCDMGNDTNRHVINIVENGLRTITARSGWMVDSGIAYYDKGDRIHAAMFLRKALTIFPKDPRANYQAGWALMTSDVSKILGTNQTYLDFYKESRACDPLYEPAYRNEADIAVDMMATLHGINRSFNKISTGKFSEKDILDFAQGCEAINENELAAYAYHLYLHMNFTKTSEFDLSVAKKLSECIRTLGAQNAADNILEWYRTFNEHCERSRERNSGARSLAF